MCGFTGRYIRHESQNYVTWVEWVWEVVRVWLGLCNSVWFGISGKLRGREGWWDQVPLERCLIETDAPYLGGGGRI